VIAVKDAKQIAALRKEIMAVIPNSHNINVDTFVERLYLRGCRVIYGEAIEGEDG
jgi:hypothetical protein